MSDVKKFIEENEPVDQDKIEEKFGSRGISELRRLMRKNEVSYSLDWMVVTEK